MSAPDPRAAARAVDALRRGWAIGIGPMTCLPIETADAVQLAAFDPDGMAATLIGGSRAATLKLINQRAAADPGAPVLIARRPDDDIAALNAIANPAADLATPFKGPFRALSLEHLDEARTALTLARLAGILPAFVVRESGSSDATVTPADVDAFTTADRLAIVARAALPVSASDRAEIVAFRSPEGAGEHVALIVGSPRPTPLVRLHSECLTGDVFGSLKCDCGPQLQAALSLMAADGGGILLYLRQEGRGIGLVNKLRAYQLQDQGFDTVDANLRLGFAVDARDFSVAARMLSLLGATQVRLLTNNPDKVLSLETAGITVVERVAHALPPNPHNVRYLETKRMRTGHDL